MISLLVAIPLLSAFLSVIWKRISRYALLISAIANLVLILVMRIPQIPVIHEIGGWKPPFGVNLVYDGASASVLFVVNGFFLLVSFMNWITGGYETVVMILLASLNGFVLTGDLFNSFVFLEITAIASIVIASKHSNYYSAFKYLIFSGLAGAFYLLATVFVYAGTGSLNMASVSSISLTSRTVIAVTTLYIVGLGVEAKIFPLNGWVSGVYGDTDLAPVLLSSAVTFSMVYMVGRIFITVFHGRGLYVLYPLALATIVAGELAALRQEKLLKTLAYSSIAQVGIVLVALSKGVPESLKLAYFHLMNETIANFVLFSIAVFLVYNYGDIPGVFKENRVLGAAFTASSFSVIGFPMFAGFRSKLMIMMDSFEKGDYVLPAIILIAGIVEVAYLIRWNVRLWFEETSEIGMDSPMYLRIVSVFLAALLILIFLWPNPFLEFSGKIAESISNWSSYTSAVLGGM